MKAALLVGIVALAAAGGAATVTLDTLLETPILKMEPVFSAKGAELIEFGTGMVADEIDGEACVTWNAEDASLTISADMQPGNWKVRALCWAPNGSTDSFFFALDGQEKPEIYRTPKEILKWADHGFRIDEAGEHEVTLTLREGPGMKVVELEVARLSVQPDHEPMLEEFAEAHPRLYLTPEVAAKLPELAEAAKEYYAPSGPPSSTLQDYDAKKSSCGWARGLPRYALAYRLNPSDEYLALLKAQVMNIASFPHWGNPKWGRMWDTDLDAEYAMEGLALCYDWLHDEWTPEERETIRARIELGCRRIFTASLGGRTCGSHDFQQNHFWFPHYALMLGAAAIYEDTPEAREWLAWAYDRMERVLLTFADDGGFHEHASYWDFSFPPLFQYIDLYEQLTGRKIPAGEEWLSKTAYYRFHNVFPSLKGSAALGDCKKSTGPGSLTNYMWLAKRYDDATVRGMVNLLKPGPGSPPYYLLYAEPGAPTKDPREELPLAHYFDDIETAFMRTGWDEGATMAAFICRPMGGKTWWNIAHQYGLNAVGHNHPDANSFILYGRGEVLCVDPGYTYSKLTKNHNTVLVNGKGQFGNAEMWPRMNDGWGEIEEFRHEDGSTYARGNATRQYPEELGLTRFVREFELKDRDHVTITDELAAEEPTTFTWLLHHEGEMKQLGPDEFEMTKGEAKMGIRVTCEAPHEAKLGEIEPNYEHTLRSVRPDDAPV
ncbi:MAG TPA: DUF4962 domain-containing protein, partial [Armatimonadota bacterium]|nr:DUF4962 domain-containing protein [Armatimonadota bacterium]